MEVQSLIEKTMPAGGRCDLDEYLHGDDDLPVCMDLDNDSWETDLLDQLGQDEKEADEEEDEGEDEMDIEPPPPKILNYKEAVQALEDVQHFLESRGYIEEALHIGSEVDTMTILKLKSSKQTILHDYWV